MTGDRSAVPILMYHNVARAPRKLPRLRSLYVSPGAFGRQMWLLRQLGYSGLSMSAAMPYLRGERQGRVAVITLDDGYADNLEAALPVLARHGFSATCYVVSGSIGRWNTWDAERLGVRKPLMSLDQLRQWQQAGMEIGAHSHTHPHLTRCDDVQLRDEIVASKRHIEDATGASVTQFCYPYGDVDDRVAAQACAAGYAAATTTHRGRAMPGMNLWRLPRIRVARHHTLAHLAMKALSRYEDRRG